MFNFKYLVSEKYSKGMDTLRFEGTKVRPQVVFDPEARLLSISGYSRPENARELYFPLLQWIQDFKLYLVENKAHVDNAKPVDFQFKFIYFNSSSSKFIYDIVVLLGEMQKEGIPVKISWHFDEDDDEIREAGEEMSEMANLPFFFFEAKR